MHSEDQKEYRSDLNIQEDAYELDANITQFSIRNLVVFGVCIWGIS